MKNVFIIAVILFASVSVLAKGGHGHCTHSSKTSSPQSNLARKKEQQERTNDAILMDTVRKHHLKEAEPYYKM